MKTRSYLKIAGLLAVIAIFLGACNSNAEKSPAAVPAAPAKPAVEKIGEFSLNLPSDNTIESFFKKHGKEFKFFNFAVNDKGFSSNHNLRPGSTTKVVLCLVNDAEETEISDFMSKNGLSPLASNEFFWAWRENKGNIPFGSKLICFDKPENLFALDTTYGFPRISQNRDSTYFVTLSHGIFSGDYLIFASN